MSKDPVELLFTYLKERVELAKGRLITFRPAQVINVAVKRGEIVVDGRDIKLRKLNKKIRDVCETLCEFGLLTVVKRCSRGKVYGFSRGSIMYNILSICDDRILRCVIEKVREYMKNPKNFEEQGRNLASELVMCVESKVGCWGKSL